MPPKASTGKKQEKKKQDRIIEDKTFGLKNKNKSKKVQEYVQTVSNTVRSSSARGGRPKTDEEKLRERKAAKEAKKAAEAELNTLFNEALLAAPSKTGGSSQGKGADAPVAVALETKEKVVQETVEIEEGERTIEDLIEEQRAKLAAEGKQGTPVTAESLAKWKADRAAKRREEERERLAAELKKKKGGKGLSVLSGRALFEYDQSLFVDDDGAAGTDEMNQRDEEAAQADAAEGEEAAAGAGDGGSGSGGGGGFEEDGYDGGGEGGGRRDEDAAGAEEHKQNGGKGVEVQASLFAGEEDDLSDLDEEEDEGD